MISYRNIPVSVRESSYMRHFRHQISGWPSMLVIQNYMEASGIAHKTNPGQKAEEKTGNAAIYYILKQELFKRMSSLVGHRSEEYLFLNNKALLDQVDRIQGRCDRGGRDLRYKGLK